MEQYKDKAIEHVETNKKTKAKIVTDRQRVVYKLIEDGHWTSKYFRGRLHRGCKQVPLEKPEILEFTYFLHHM